MEGLVTVAGGAREAGMCMMTLRRDILRGKIEGVWAENLREDGEIETRLVGVFRSDLESYLQERARQPRKRRWGVRHPAAASAAD